MAKNFERANIRLQKLHTRLRKKSISGYFDGFSEKEKQVIKLELLREKKSRELDFCWRFVYSCGYDPQNTNPTPQQLIELANICNLLREIEKICKKILFQEKKYNLNSDDLLLAFRKSQEGRQSVSY
jgi:hypothetical protein